MWAQVDSHLKGANQCIPLSKKGLSRPMKSLLTISTASMRQNLDHCDVTYNKSRYEKFKDTLVSLQTNAGNAVTTTFTGSFSFVKST